VNTPSPAKADAVLEALRRVMMGNNRLHAALASELGINPTELSALTHVASEPGLTPKALSALLGITTGSTTSTTDHLARAGFVVREPHPGDRRSILLDLTPAGRHAMLWVLEQYERALASTYALHPDARPDVIAGFLTDLATQFDQTVTKP